MTSVSENYMALGVFASLLAILLIGFFLCLMFFRLRKYHMNTHHRSNQQIERASSEVRKLFSDNKAVHKALLSNQKLIVDKVVGFSTALGEVSKSIETLETLETKARDEHANVVSQITALRDELSAYSESTIFKLEGIVEETGQLGESIQSDAARFSIIGEKLVEQQNEFARISRSIDGFSNCLRAHSRQLNGVVSPQLNTEQVFTDQVSSVSSRIAGVADSVLIENEPLTFLVAGMRHSGSTALFNAIRYLLEMLQISYDAGYSQGTSFKSAQLRGDKARVIKVHEFRDDLLDAADVIFTTRRDVRDTVASATRREFALLDRVGGAVEYAKYNCMLHTVWKEYSDYEFVYESFVENEEKALKSLVSAMGFEEVDISELAALVNNIPTDQYEQTLLSPEHQTDRERKASYRKTLPEKEVREITGNHLRWLTDYGFEVS